MIKYYSDIQYAGIPSCNNQQAYFQHPKYVGGGLGENQEVYKWNWKTWQYFRQKNNLEQAWKAKWFPQSTITSQSS